ncbi:uncharacterized protein LOC110882671 [Helianthus annuus]|uniref:uncharacterized protein LOC110882671 n=1 Tax=Helianthus annuus TaxID=4232 RepID=UPI000B8F1985|nr:uncharacterized protein LOC110882671 [Helianthus annuus]
MRKGKSFWQLRSTGNSASSWRYILKIRDRVRPFIVSKIGNGHTTSAWFDRWAQIGPLCHIVSARRLHNAGFNLDSKVSDIVNDGDWGWPRAWMDLFPVLLTIQPPVLNPHKSDSLIWRDVKGNEQEYSASIVWDSLRSQGDTVPWVEIVWFANCIPRHAFLSWLICKKKLKTQDKLKQWDVGTSTNLNLLSCPLCSLVPDSHDHLFFECSFSMQVWSSIKSFAGIQLMSSKWEDIVEWLIHVPSKKSMRSVIGRLLLSATAYFIWQERNQRLFKSKKRTVHVITEAIVSTVRLKLASVKIKSSMTGKSLLEKWNVPRL